jgi:hypothetical protein
VVVKGFEYNAFARMKNVPDIATDRSNLLSVVQNVISEKVKEKVTP